MKKVLLALMVVAIAGVASANLLVNGGFETPFADGYGQNYDPAVNGSFAYMSFPSADYIPGWSTTPATARSEEHTSELQSR